jgi:hypothetical protein
MWRGGTTVFLNDFKWLSPALTGISEQIAAKKHANAGLS